jgi:1-pyrroline-5-carboxylate dehydrogenase
VIDEKSFDNIARYVAEATEGAGYEVVCGGGLDKSKGFFVEPTVVRSEEPGSKLMREEIFGPLLTVFVYEDDDLDQTLSLCDSTSPYALTGAVFAQDRKAIDAISTRLRHAAGNFYVNDKPTGAVVGQQPFGGGRASGTNDKAGSAWNLLRWTSVRSIKETFVPPRSFEYPHMTEK